MIPTLDYFEPTGDTTIDLIVKLNLLTQENKISWTYHASDPRDRTDRFAQRERNGVGQWFTYRPEDTPWTFLLYQLSQPEGPMRFPHLDERTRTPHLQLLDSNRRVAQDFRYRQVLDDLVSTVYYRSRVDEGAREFISEFTRA